MLEKENKSLRALHFEIDDDEGMVRILGRLVHPPSGRSYHTKFRPPKTPMTDDVRA